MQVLGLVKPHLPPHTVSSFPGDPSLISLTMVLIIFLSFHTEFLEPSRAQRGVGTTGSRQVGRGHARDLRQGTA